MESFDKREFGKRLKVDIKSKFGSIKELAARIEIDPSTISNYTRGVREPRAKFLGILAKLGCDTNWLLTGEKSKSDPSEEEMDKITALTQLIGELQIQLKQVNSRIEALEKDKTG